MSRPASILLRSAKTASRSLHTTTRALNGELPPTPKSAEALGFKNQPGRQRTLPKDLNLKIKISDSGKKDILTASTNGGNNKAHLGRSNKPKNNVSQPASTGAEVDSPDFFENSNIASSSSSSTGTGNSNPSKHKSRRDVQGVSMDLIDQPSSASSPSLRSNSRDLPPDVLRRQRRENRTNNINNNNSSSRNRQSGQGRRDGSQRRSREAVNLIPREKRAGMLPKRQITFDQLDHVEPGLFGKGHLIASNVNGNSAATLGLGHPRKTTSLRQGSSSPSFPTSPIPILSTIPSRSADQAIQVASWTAALNGSIPLRFKDQLCQTVKSQLGR
ncbi:uncharacterized protein I303_105061 [Kwoniella dejecticola CBS 10117]|uniref:Uncharacterized protein n=1 Tax=Kwoniella dejecticola CBS 10117 TaxID=1296121 RepID=A0A1A6A3K5_9TREE|nr:uncharacterized protein I303_05493 [Kwoniella dejecticola CBS 10117]OBR84634.1 hypothetical protein I303_05493 [Kwoniella dejecticola CBS 10117]